MYMFVRNKCMNRPTIKQRFITQHKIMIRIIEKTVYKIFYMFNYLIINYVDGSKSSQHCDINEEKLRNVWRVIIRITV